MHWVVWLLGVLVVLGILIYIMVLALSIPYAAKCQLLTPTNYTFIGNQLGICWYESSGDLPYDKCSQDLVDTENHGTIVGSSTCGRHILKFSFAKETFSKEKQSAW